MDYMCLNGSTPDSAKAVHSRLTMPDILKIAERNRFNMDEIGMMEGMVENYLVLGEAIRKMVLLKDAFKREWISIIVCVSTDGRALQPLVIFSGKSVQHQWFLETQGRPSDWDFDTSRMDEH